MKEENAQHKEGRRSHRLHSPFYHLTLVIMCSTFCSSYFGSFSSGNLKKANHHLPWCCEVDIWRVECNFIWDFNSGLEVKKLECCC